MNLIIALLILIVLFGGGGLYYRGPVYGGYSILTILVIVLIFCVLTGRT